MRIIEIRFPFVDISLSYSPSFEAFLTTSSHNFLTFLLGFFVDFCALIIIIKKKKRIDSFKYFNREKREKLKLPWNFSYLQREALRRMHVSTIQFQKMEERAGMGGKINVFGEWQHAKRSSQRLSEGNENTPITWLPGGRLCQSG